MASVAMNRYNKAKRMQVESVERPLSGFGARPLIEPKDMYLKFPKLRQNGGGTGSVTTKKELGIKLTDFFDYTTYDSTAGGVAQPVANYYWNVDQNLFDTSGAPPGGQEQTFCRVRSLCVWVMPACRSTRNGVSPQPEDNATAMFTVNCQTPGMGTQLSATTQAFALNTQVTNVLPSINPRWKKVFSCDLQKTFQSGTVRPVFESTSVNNFTQQCLFQMSVVTPDTGETYLTGDDQLPIRVKVQLILDQPIGTTQSAELAVWNNEEFALPFTEQNGAPFPGTAASYVQLDLQSVRDNLR